MQRSFWIMAETGEVAEIKQELDYEVSVSILVGYFFLILK